MSPDLKAFFTKITADKALQERLYLTNEITDVAQIAREMGYQISAADILRAQAGRVLSLPKPELAILAAGGKPKNGAQWGREGNGYLERAGYWLLELKPQEIMSFLGPELEAKLLAAKSYNEAAAIIQGFGHVVTGVELLKAQAKRILELNDEEAERVAHGA